MKNKYSHFTQNKNNFLNKICSTLEQYNILSKDLEIYSALKGVLIKCTLLPKYPGQVVPQEINL